MNPIQQSRPRRGRSLLEAVVMISILSIVVGLSTTSLATLFRFRRQQQRDTEQAVALDRLAMRLRSDAHDATSASLDDGCTLALADGRTIRYAAQSQRIVREIRDEETTAHRDTFALPYNATVTFTREGQSPGGLIRLTIGQSESPRFTRDLPRTATIEAAIGLHPTLAQTAREP
jgi:type II secretory pathway pseudopilin PulG